MIQKTGYRLMCLTMVVLSVNPLLATDYHVGPGKDYASIGEVPWELLQAGDRVYIHWRSDADGGPYHEKWVINVAATAENPLLISGVPGPGGERPVIDGSNAVTRTELSYWSEQRGIIKVGGSGTPENDTASYIIIENLEIRNAHPDYSFTDDAGNTVSYVKNAAGIFIESGQHITVRNCVIHNCGNGLFSAWESGHLLIEHNYFFENGIAGSLYEHNAYTESTVITYQFNRFGPLRSGALGNNLKDRSAGLVVRYNWIEGGNRLLDLVESDYPQFYNNPIYNTTYVYGNILIEKDGGNPQVIHYGGDNGVEETYRKGKLYFYNNTLYSTRSDKTTLIRLSTNDESADIRNNILYVTGAGHTFALLDNSGQVALRHNMIKPGWVQSHSGSISGSIDDDGYTRDGTDPGFVDAANYDFHLLATSNAIDKGTGLPAEVLPAHALTLQYRPHQDSVARANDGTLDLGAFEFRPVVTGNTDYLEDNRNRPGIYPNPVYDKLYVNTQPGSIRAARIYTAGGRVVDRFYYPENNTIAVSHLEEGVYLMEIHMAGEKYFFKFIKRNR